MIVKLEHVTKIYREGHREVPALRDISLSLNEGEWIAIVGPSGCGKSTLLNLIAGLDRPTHGKIEVDGTDLSKLSQEALVRWRREHVGIVFQFFQLLPTLTALENVQLPLVLAGRPNSRSRALALLEQVGLLHLANRLPSDLSGGEQQRVAIARALANQPRLLLADEPTGNLDRANGELVLDIFTEVWSSGTTLILVTHDQHVAERAQRRLELQDGVITSDILVQ